LINEDVARRPGQPAPAEPARRREGAVSPPCSDLRVARAFVAGLEFRFLGIQGLLRVVVIGNAFMPIA